jgi:hypothetical protein
MIKNFKDYHFINEESAPRIPVSEEYWKNKGKSGKDVCLHFHDDMDGIFSAIVTKKWLVDKGFRLVSYNVVNYSEGWNNVVFDTNLINVAVDYAEDHENIDVYIDHHGLQENPESNKKFSIKTKTGSAYEGICLQLGVPVDNLILSVIDMIDSAKYADYGIDILTVLDMNLPKIKNDKKARLLFAGALNQMVKRSDYKTLIEIVENTTSPSIFAIYHQFKKYYPGNNVNARSGVEKDFKDDADWRLGKMKNMTQGRVLNKIMWKNQEEFVEGYLKLPSKDRPKGYQILGDLAFIPTGTWANPIRARAILEKDIREGIIPKGKIKFIFLQYGATLQVCSFDKLSSYDSLPVLRSGKKVEDLGEYMTNLVNFFKDYDKLQYDTSVTKYGSDPSEVTVNGGHTGIGTISNIIRRCEVEGPYKGYKYTDLFKNKIIQDLSGISWPRINVAWREAEEAPKTKDGEEPKINPMMLQQDKIRKIGRL